MPTRDTVLLHEDVDLPVEWVELIPRVAVAVCEFASPKVTVAGLPVHAWMEAPVLGPTFTNCHRTRIGRGYVSAEYCVVRGSAAGTRRDHPAIVVVFERRERV